MAEGWSFACPGWEERLARGESLMPPLPLNAGEASRAVAIYDRLKLPDVPGQPTLGEAGAEWFRDCVRAVFGSMDEKTGVRRVPGLFVMVPKKNSKTSNGGAMMLTALFMNRRPNAPFALFGPTQEIAEIAYSTVAGMIEADDELKKLFRVQDHLKRISMRVGPGAGATLKITTFDPAVATGGKFAGWLLDEVHLLGGSPKAERVIGQLRGARTAVPEQFGVIITTQSDEPPAGVFKSELTYARAVRDGRVKDATVLPLLYEFPEKMQRDAAKPWANPDNWPMVLPNLGRSVNIDVLLSEYHTAIEKGEGELRRWASQHLNVEIGMALHGDRWAGADSWEKATDPELTLERLIETSEVCTVGSDGGGMDDLLGLAVLGRHRETRRWQLWTHAWCHPEALKRRKEIAPRLRDFAAQGDLTICTGATQDVEEVADLIDRLWQAGLLPAKQGIGLDPACIGEMLDELAARGIPDEAMTAVRQGGWLAQAIWGVERKLDGGTFVHADQPMMTWCVGNARVETKGNRVAITKQVAGRSKIDPLIAALNAAQLMIMNPEAAGGAATPWDTDPDFRLAG